MIKQYAPSPVRVAQQYFEKRVKKEKENKQQITECLNVGIGNVSLPTHPKLLERLNNIKNPNLKKGIWSYSSTTGSDESNNAFLNIINSFTKKEYKLFSVMTDGSSPLMDVVFDLFTGKPTTNQRPLLTIEPLYGNYPEIAYSRHYPITAVTRKLNDNGKYSNVDPKEIEQAIIKNKPGALLIIPADNPTGQLMPQSTIIEYAKLCVKHNIFLIEDAAYRGLFYIGDEAPTIWNLTNKNVEGIEEAKIRVSLESLSKVFNSCGLRAGCLVSDNQEVIENATNNRTMFLCSDVIMQYLAGALKNESKEDLQKWMQSLRDYYKKIIPNLHKDLLQHLPKGTIVSQPESSVYLVVDFKNIVDDKFNSLDFVKYCATEGKVDLDGKPTTVLTSPMNGFYLNQPGKKNLGDTQLRISVVRPEDEMKKVPIVLGKLIKQYLEK